MEISSGLLLIVIGSLCGLSCVLSLIALLHVPALPKKLFQSMANCEGHVAKMEEKLDAHVRRDTSDAGVAARRAKAAAGGNGGGIQMGDYRALEAQLFGEDQQRMMGGQ